MIVSRDGHDQRGSYEEFILMTIKKDRSSVNSRVLGRGLLKASQQPSCVSYGYGKTDQGAEGSQSERSQYGAERGGVDAFILSGPM